MEKEPSGPSGLVLEIQRMSTEDGPGLRTTMFMKGCSLACRWCHNPESISPKPQVRWIENRCIGCRECLDICPVSALKDADGITILRDLCTGCGLCADHCPSGALELWGRRMTVAEALSELVKDRAYFGEHGGVTLSGGEATLQAPFVAELFCLLKKEGLHTALDTCGTCTADQFAASCEHADLILFDLKESDPALHRLFTGGSLDRVLDRFKQAVRIVEDSRVLHQGWPNQRPKSLWVRTPVIPGMTDRKENIAGIARFISEYGNATVDRWELCSFNNLCRDKYRHLGRVWELEDAGLMKADAMDDLLASALNEGTDPAIVCWTGMVRDEKE